MLAEQLLHEGNLDACLRDLQAQIRHDPSNARFRIFLFQLLSVLGRWKQAKTQLAVIKDLEASAWPMVQTYADALSCEMLREEIFAGRHTPVLFGKPSNWVALMIEALRLSADGQSEAAQELRERAFEEAPAIPGSLNGSNFDWIADADSRLGPILEAIVNGAYYWVPFDQIKEIRIQAPEDLRDYVWTPAQLTWANEGESVALIPSIYPGSHNSNDAQVSLGRRTEWKALGLQHYAGKGQRVFATDSDEYALLDIRHVTFETAQD